MKLEDKIAVLKVAGFQVRDDPDHFWEWYLPEKSSPDGQSRLGLESYTSEKTAWESAWRYIQGYVDEEFDSEPYKEE